VFIIEWNLFLQTRFYPSLIKDFIMLLRVRLPDGSTSRINCEPTFTLSQLAKLIFDLGNVQGTFELYSDVKFNSVLQPAHETLSLLGLSHGDFVYVRGSMLESHEQRLENTNGNNNSDSKTSQSVKSDSQMEIGERNESPPRYRCLHGPKGMCEHCMPKENPRERYQRELDKWKNRKGTSIAVMEALEALRFKIKAQESGSCTAVSVDTRSANSFQAYLAQLGFSQQRIGLLYGTIDDENVTHCEVIYEPPQNGSHDVYSLNSAEESGDINQRADLVAKHLNMKRVGMIFSAKPRKCIFSGIDIVTAAKFATEFESENGEMVAPDVGVKASDFVIICVALADDGQTLFEAFQLSDQCLEMYRTGIFRDVEEQKPNSGRVKVRDAVLVEGKETFSVHTEFFLINVPIRGHDSWLRTSFPVENRELRPQQPTDLSVSMKKLSEAPFYKQISDYHLLLYLSNIMDVHTDMPGLCSIVAQQRPPSDTEEGYRLMIEALASAHH